MLRVGLLLAALSGTIPACSAFLPGLAAWMPPGMANSAYAPGALALLPSTRTSSGSWERRTRALQGSMEDGGAGKGEETSGDEPQSFRARAQELLRRRREVNYFAYGANLDPEVLTGIRKVKPLASRAGQVDGWSLRFSAGAFPFVGPAYGSAEPDGGELGLHGVVFTLSKADWAKVQLTEAAGLSYSVEPVTVKTYDGDLVESLTLRAMQPFRVPEGLQGSISRPSERYMGKIEKGAKEYGLDDEYRERLSKIKRFPVG